jgi:hypothetical protein
MKARPLQDRVAVVTGAARGIGNAAPGNTAVAPPGQKKSALADIRVGESRSKGGGGSIPPALLISALSFEDLNAGRVKPSQPG